eukprot:1734863-Pleurochrysis_carterae.AAC.2
MGRLNRRVGVTAGGRRHTRVDERSWAAQAPARRNTPRLLAVHVSRDAFKGLLDVKCGCGVGS